MAAAGVAVNNTDKKVTFKNCDQFTNCITEINNMQLDKAQDTDVVMTKYNLIEYSDAYSKTSGSLWQWQYYRDEPALDDNNNVTNFCATNNISFSFKFKHQITGQTKNSGTNMLKWWFELKSNFEEHLKCLWLIMKLVFSWNGLVASTAANQNPNFEITDTKLYVATVTSSVQDNINCLNN